MNNKPRDQSFLAQKPKIGYENSQNRQTENLNAPMLIEEWKNKKQNQQQQQQQLNGPALHYVTQTLFWRVTQHLYFLLK